MIDLHASIDEVPLAYLDVETTGLNPRYGDRVIEIAMLRIEGGEAVDALQQLVHPQRHVSPGAYAVNGISDEMLRDAPIFAQVADQVLAVWKEAVVVGHNTPFDLGFMAAELGRLGISLPEMCALDTLRLARHYAPMRSYALGNVARTLGVTVDGQAHRAMVDVLQTKGIFEHLVDDLWRRGLRVVDDYVQAQGGAIRTTPAPPSRDIPPVIQEAIQGGLLVRLRYLSASGVETERMVRPITVSEQSGSPLLVAHCLLRDERRCFRIDRILEMELVKEWP